MEKLKPKTKSALSWFLLIGIIFSVIQIARSAAPNPGHPWSQVGTSGTEVLTVARGGSGTSTLAAESIILGNGTNAVKLVAPGTSGNLLTANGTSWTSATSPSSLTGAISLIYSDSANSSEINNDTSENTLKSWVMDVTNTTYSYYILQATLEGNDGLSANRNMTFTWNLKEGANLKKTFIWRSFSRTTVGFRRGIDQIAILKTIVPNTIPNAANLIVNGQMSNASVSVTMMAHSFRVFGVK